jgi:3-hydroxyacyl-[acyl-carrier-protein] dehydratase
MRFHLIDRLDAWEPGAWVRATKLTSRSEEHWHDGEMRASLVVETFLQAGTWLVMATTDRRRRAALLSIGALEICGPVEPGDVLDVHGVVETMGAETAVLSGSVRVGDRPVLECRDVMCALIDADELEDPSDVERMQTLLIRGSVS